MKKLSKKIITESTKLVGFACIKTLENEVGMFCYRNVQKWSVPKYDEHGLEVLEPAMLLEEDIKAFKLSTWTEFHNWARHFDQVEVILLDAKNEIRPFKRKSYIHRKSSITLVSERLSRRLTENEKEIRTSQNQACLAWQGINKPVLQFKKRWAVVIVYEDHLGQMQRQELHNEDLTKLKASVRGYTNRMRKKGCKISKLPKDAYKEQEYLG